MLFSDGGGVVCPKSVLQKTGQFLLLQEMVVMEAAGGGLMIFLEILMYKSLKYDIKFLHYSSVSI